MAIIEKVIIPALLALVTGIIIGLTSGLFAHWRAWEAPGLTGALVGCLAMALCWLALLQRFGSAGGSSTRVEHFEDPPLQVNPSETIQLNITWNDGQAGIYSMLGVSFDQFRAWCEGVSLGRSLGENHWTGSQGVFSKSQYHAMRDELELRGLLRMRGKHYSSGYELTRRGELVTGEIARRYGVNPSPVEGYQLPNYGILPARASEREGERRHI